MKRSVTTCAAVCLFLTNAGHSVANVSIPFADSWSHLESVKSQSYIPDAWFTWAGPGLFSGEIVSDDTADEDILISADAFWTLSESDFHPVGCLNPGRGLITDSLTSLYSSNVTYPYVDLTELGEIAVLDGLVLQPALPSGSILLGGIAVGLIGWFWRLKHSPLRNIHRE